MFSIRISFLSKSIPVALPLQGIKRRKLLAGKFTSNASKCSKYLRTVSPHVFFFFLFNRPGDPYKCIAIMGKCQG